MNNDLMQSQQSNTHPQSTNEENNTQNVPSQETPQEHAPTAEHLQSPEHGEHGLHISSEETQEELKSKMGEIKRHDTERATLAQARELGIGYVSMQSVVIDPDTLKMISQSQAQLKKVVCFYYAHYQELRIGSPDPLSEGVQEVKKILSEKHHTPVKVFLMSEPSFEEVLEQYERLPQIKHVGQKVDLDEHDLNQFQDIHSLEKLQDSLRKANTTELVSMIMAAGLQFDASDIHIESEEDKLVLRFRLDGVLHEIAALDKTTYKPISSRIKLLSKLKINIIDRPQDGHFVITTNNGKIDVRVSTLPTNYGESIVMRILRSDMGAKKIEELGLNSRDSSFLLKEIKKPNGMLVVCGPTGSGKTTTLYAILNKINSPENKILTIEDPIEYEISGISQSQVNNDKGYTFSAGLRSLVRQDPDVILVGEMRDQETIEIAINAALTGHYVLSTLHTNDAAGAIPRFLAMGAKPYLLSPSLNAILSQRLVRKLCSKCRKPTTLPEDQRTHVAELIEKLPEELKSELPTERIFYTIQGCDACQGTGYKGRMGIFELFIMNPQIEKLTLSGEMSTAVIREALASQGMTTMIQDGILKALKGITTIEEVFRVAQER